MSTTTARPDPKAHLLADLLALVERGEMHAAAMIRVARGVGRL